jgi:transcription antitermination protein NusB
MNDQLTADQQRRARRAALWILYGMDVADTWSTRAMHQSRHTAAELEPELDALWPQVVARIEGILDDKDRLDEVIRSLSPRWKLERMAYVDRNILRVGIYELEARALAPIIVVNACVELAKEFGDKTTPRFVNGLLDQFCKNHGLSMH